MYKEEWESGPETSHAMWKVTFSAPTVCAESAKNHNILIIFSLWHYEAWN